jgi:hypothetical protein
VFIPSAFEFHGMTQSPPPIARFNATARIYVLLYVNLLAEFQVKLEKADVLCKFVRTLLSSMTEKFMKF